MKQHSTFNTIKKHAILFLLSFAGVFAGLKVADALKEDNENNKTIESIETDVQGYRQLKRDFSQRVMKHLLNGNSETAALEMAWKDVANDEKLSDMDKEKTAVIHKELELLNAVSKDKEDFRKILGGYPYLKADNVLEENASYGQIKLKARQCRSKYNDMERMQRLVEENRTK